MVHASDMPNDELESFPSPELIGDPFAFYAAGRESGRIHKVPSREDYLLFRHEDIRQVLENEDLFSAYVPTAHESKGLHYRGAIHLGAQDEPAHGPNRHLLSRPFAPGRLNGYEMMIREHVDALIDAFPSDGRVELTTQFAYPLPTLVISSLMGFPTSGPDFEFLLRWSGAFTSGEFHDFDVFAEMHDYMDKQIARRLDDPTDDILSDFLQRQITRDGGYDPGLGNVFATEMIAGGVTTTGQLIANAMVLLLAHPEELERVRSQPELITSVLEETMRLESPVQWMQRYVMNEVMIDGVTIPAGATVTMLYASGNRDADVFDEPEAFRIGRPNIKRHFGFGLGRHFCLGAPLARLEGRIAFERLFARFSEIRLVGTLDELENIDSRHFRVPKTLPVEFSATV